MNAWNWVVILNVGIIVLQAVIAVFQYLLQQSTKKLRDEIRTLIK